MTMAITTCSRLRLTRVRLLASALVAAALELKSLAPDGASPVGKSFYLICLNRSFVDGLTGVKGALIRGTVKSRSRDSLARHLAGVKQKIEAANAAR